jgi:hypothetical protein
MALDVTPVGPSPARRRSLAPTGLPLPISASKAPARTKNPPHNGGSR